MGFVNPILGGGGALVRPAIKSPNYVAGTAGWSINRTGSAEFNDLLLRGVFSGSTYVINESGIFLYAAAPAHGNIVGSWASVAGTDAYDNAYPAGLALYDGTTGAVMDQLGGPQNAMWNQLNGEFVGMKAGNFVMGVGDPAAGIDLARVGLLGVLGNGIGSVLQSPTTAGFPTAASATILSGTAGGATGTVNAPAVQFSGDLAVQGNLVKATSAFDSASDRQVPETWHTPSLVSGWANANLRYRLDAMDNLVVDGLISFTGTAVTAAGSQSILSAALPAAYRPAAQSRIPVAHFTSTGVVKNVNAAMTFDTAGGVSVLWGDGMASTSHDVSGLATGDRFEVYASIPLGHLA